MKVETARPARRGLDGARAAQWDAARLAFEAALAVQETPDARRLGSRVVVPEPGSEGSLSESGPSRSTTAAVEPIQPLGSLYGSRTMLDLGARVGCGAAGNARRTRALGRSCAGHGWVAVDWARHAQAEECAEHARRAMVIAREAGVGDLEVFALSLLGRAEVSAGRRDEECGCSRRRWRPPRPDGCATCTLGGRTAI